VRTREADTLLRFVRIARPVAATAVTVTTDADDDRRAQADRIVRHWRNELVPLAALPGVGGRFTQPIREVLAGTVQGLLILSLARLCDVRDEREQVRLVAALMLREDLPAGWRPAAPEPKPAEPAEPAEAGKARTLDTGGAAEASGQVDAGAAADAGGEVDAGGSGETIGEPHAAGEPAAVGERAGAAGGPQPGPVVEETAEQAATWRLIAGQIPLAVYRAARELWTVYSLSGQRAEGRLWHRALGNLPAVGVIGATLGERHALSEIAADAYVELGLAAVEVPGSTVAHRAATAAKSVAAHLPGFGRSAPNPFRKP
jgi:hypothetical protein